MNDYGQSAHKESGPRAARLDWAAFATRVRTGASKLFSFPVFLGACLVAGAFANASFTDVAAGKIFAEGDTWWHIVVGERILSTHTWPTTDPYSFTVPGNPWIAYEWLGEVVMALAMRLGGLSGLAVLLVILAALLTLLLYHYAWLLSGNVKAATAASAVVLPLAGFFFTLRPQLLAYIFLLITLICLEHFRRGRSKALWVLPGVFLIWVNTHGSFVVGLFVMGLYWACGLVSFHHGRLVAERWTPRQRRQLLATLLCCVLALLVTPYGTRLATYPLELLLQQPHVTSDITEWQPLNFSTPYGHWFLALLLVAFLSQVLSPVVYRLEILALFLFTILESFLHARFLIFFVLVFAPILATYLARWTPPYEAQKDHPWVNAALTALILWLIVACFPSRKTLDHALAIAYPVGAVDYLRQHPVPAGMFNEDDWGGFLVWSLGPQHRVFIDGRADIYEYGGVLLDYIRIISLDRNVSSLLQGYGLKACLLHRGIPLETYLSTLAGWERAYQDQSSVIFVRKKGTESSSK